MSEENNFDRTLKAACEISELAHEEHIKYFHRFLSLNPAEMCFQDCSRLYIAFLVISGLDLLNALDTLSEEEKSHIIDWVYSLQILPSDKYTKSQCGFQGSVTHIIEGCNHGYETSHLAMTYTGLAILIILGDDLSRVNKEAILEGVKSLQLEDGSFSAAQNLESDMRFVYCAASISYFLNDFRAINLNKLKHFIKSSINYDGGLGQGPELESHGGSTFCAIAALHLCGILRDVFDNKNISNLIRWCISRQLSGFQGRPNKLADTCYSFWLGGTLQLLNVFDKIDCAQNREYILSTQDNSLGGFSKQPELYSDPLHTYLGLCGLSLMNESSLLPIHPALNISKRAHIFLKKLHESWNSIHIIPSLIFDDLRENSK